MRYTTAGILSAIIVFGVITFVFFDRKPVKESAYISTETIVKSPAKISESNTVSSAVTIESSTEVTNASSDEG